MSMHATQCNRRLALSYDSARRCEVIELDAGVGERHRGGSDSSTK